VLEYVHVALTLTRGHVASAPAAGGGLSQPSFGRQGPPHVRQPCRKHEREPDRHDDRGGSAAQRRGLTNAAGARPPEHPRCPGCRPDLPAALTQIFFLFQMWGRAEAVPAEFRGKTWK